MAKLVHGHMYNDNIVDLETLIPRENGGNCTLFVYFICEMFSLHIDDDKCTNAASVSEDRLLLKEKLKRTNCFRIIFFYFCFVMFTSLQEKNINMVFKHRYFKRKKN